MLRFLFGVACIILDPNDSIVDVVSESFDKATEENRRNELQEIEENELAKLKARKRFNNEKY